MPDSDLPWMSRGVSSRPRRRVPAQPMPAPAADVPWGAGRGAAMMPPATAEEAGATPAEAGATPAEGSAPIYVWNPGSPGDSFPGLPPGQGPPGGSGDASGADVASGYGPGEPAGYRAEAPAYRDEPDYQGQQPRAHPGPDSAGYYDQPDALGAGAAGPAGPPLAGSGGYESQEPPAYPGPDPAGYYDQPGYESQQPPAQPGPDPAGY
jgi:hypothetical protein